MIRLMAPVLVLCLAAVVPVCADYTVFVDPTGLFQTSIPQEWVYQTQPSSDKLSVFYGPGSYNLVYFEVLEPVTYADPHEYLDYVITQLQGPGGLEGFRLESDLEEMDLGGAAAAGTVYSFSAGAGHRQWECLLVVLLDESRAVSVTISDAEENFAATRQVLQVVLDEWRWLF